MNIGCIAARLKGYGHRECIFRPKFSPLWQVSRPWDAKYSENMRFKAKSACCPDCHRAIGCCLLICPQRNDRLENPAGVVAPGAALPPARKTARLGCVMWRERPIEPYLADWRGDGSDDGILALGDSKNRAATGKANGPW